MTSEGRLAIYAGSFDPLTLGHVDIIQQGLALFDSVLVLVAVNPEKSFLFSVEERMDLIRKATREHPTVRVASTSGLTVDVARAMGAVALLRGVRGATEFEYEHHMAMMNRRLAPELSTVLLVPHTEHLAIHSSLVRSLAALGAPIDTLVPDVVAKALHERFSSSRTV